MNGVSGVSRETSRLTVRIGGRIRALRLARNMSLNNLAAAAGVSAGIVSQIERERANPSLNTIEKICVALGVLPDAVLGSEVTDAEPAFVCRSASRRRILVGKAPIVKEMISPPGSEGLRMMIISLPPRSENLDVIVGAGQKAGLVLEGQIRITLGDRNAILYPGDSFQFPSAQTHSLHNDTDTASKVMWIIAETPVGGTF